MTTFSIDIDRVADNLASNALPQFDPGLPIAHDPNGAEGRDLLGLSSIQGVTVTPFRVLPGDDTSCLNLYEPRQPRILGVRREFIAETR